MTALPVHVRDAAADDAASVAALLTELGHLTHAADVPARLGRVRGRRVAMVDDVMSAGSALLGTFAELRAHGAQPVAAGALLVLGTAGDRYFATHGVPVAAVARSDYALWTPADCPLCAAGAWVEDVAAAPPPGQIA